MHKSRLGTCLWVVASIFCCASAHASTSTATPEDEYKKLIRVSEDIQPLGEHPFGENIGLYNGALSFEQTDVSLAGNGPLLQLTRRFGLGGVEESNDRAEYAFADWDLEIPHLETLAAGTPDTPMWEYNPVTQLPEKIYGWQVENFDYTTTTSTTWDKNARCSHFSVPPEMVRQLGNPDLMPWEPEDWWKGYQMVLPGQGSEDLLGNPDSATRATYPVVTKSHWRFSCLATTSNGEAGEGFLAQAPDGTKYWFDRLVYRYARSMSRQLDSTPATMLKPNFDWVDLAVTVLSGSSSAHAATTTDGIIRRTAWMMVTKIQDRFGNTLTFNYDTTTGLLAGIVASDGRSLSIQYISGTPRVQSVTLQPASGSPRTWTYAYSADGLSLVSVTQPDASRWQFALTAFDNASITASGHRSCISLGIPGDLSAISGSITHPSGLTGTFTVKPVEHGRSFVPKSCMGTTLGDEDTQGSSAVFPDAWYSFTVVQRSLSGAGLPARTWTYSYSPPNASWAGCTGSCPTSVWTDVTAPDGSTVRSTFSNRYDITESRLQSTDYYAAAAGSSLLRSEIDSYATPNTQGLPALAGVNYLNNANPDQTERYFPLNQKVTVQDGDTYTWQAEAFNSYAQVTQQKRFNSIAGQPALEESLGYLNDTTLWVLGLPTTVTNVATGEVESQNVYESTRDTLSQRWRFGQQLMSYTFDTAGNLASFTDGNNHTTTLGSYKRGIPQAIGYPDSTSESLVVDDFGQITSLTDQAGKTSSYAYDGVGRLTQITYPTGDSVAWAPKVFTYAYVTAAERGIGANHWRRTVSHGNAQSVTYFDAELRPVLSDSYISTDGTSHTTARTDYDWRGQKTFVSYPQSGALNLTDLTTGTTTQYDALGRAIQTLQSSELGTLTSTTTYLSGARMQVTDPKGKVTTTTYQVFDQPSYDAVTLVQAPDGINQAITRDVYGNPQSIRQYGSYNGLTKDLTKYLYYDAYHRLCRTAEPESGSTVMAYDAANNVAWTADGLSISGADCGQSSVLASSQTTRTYDAMNRVLTLVPPAGTQSTQYTYDALGNVKTAVSGVSTWSSLRNGLGLLTSETLQITGQGAWTLGYGYDANGSLSTITYPDGTAVAYAPDALGRPTQAGGYATGVTYFANGEVSAFTFGNGALYAAQQNSRQLLSNFSYAKGSTLNVSEDYVYDANANITNVNDLAGGPRTKSFTYDDLNRLTSATATNLWGTESYTYDPLNNIASRTGGSTTVTYSYNGLNQLAGLSDGTSFVYDPRGNVINKNGVGLTFDAKNQLQNVGGSVAYAYDASGRRVSKTPTSGGATYYFYSQAGQLMYQWEPGSAKATDYVYLGKRMLARNETYNTQVTGNIDGVTIDGSGNATINGWACSTHLNQSIGVEVFAGGASGAGGVRITTATANVASEPAVASACQASGSNYRFTVPLTDAMRSQYGGQVLYVYGDSPVGVGNLVLAHSGSFTMPVARVGGAPTITSPTTGSSNTTGAYTVAWSAVTGASSYTLQEQINGGSWSTVQSSGATSLAVSGKGNGTYGYQVQACNSSGCSAWSTVVTTTVLLPPPAPGTITVPATSSGSIAVSWAASSTATSYTLQQSLNGGAWGNVYSGAATSTTRPVTTTGSYTFQVQACNASGCSAWKGSTAVAVTIPPASAPPISAPSSNNTGSYTVSWTGVSGATSYTLQEQVNGGGWTTVQSSGGGVWGATGHGNGTYGYHVQACNAGGCGPWSGTVNVVVLLPPPAPGSIMVPATSSGSIGVSWAASSTATSYTLQQSLNGGGWSTVYSGGATSTTLGAGATGSYTYQVQACNGGGCSGWKGSSAVAVTIPPASAPTLTVPGNSTTGSYTVSWTGVSGATSYTLQEQVNGGGWTTLQSNSATSIGISGKGNGTYGYHVQACNVGGCGPWSSTASATVLHVPTTPGGLYATSTQYYDPDLKPPTYYDLLATWTAVTGAASYDLQYCNSGGGCATTTVSSTIAGVETRQAFTSVIVRACNASGCSAWSGAVTPVLQ